MTDAKRGNALYGATVTYTVGHGSEITAQTRGGGILALGTLEMRTNIRVKVEKQFYDDNTENLIVGDSCGSPIDIPLNPIERDGRIVLTWGRDSPKDLDFHLRYPVLCLILTSALIYCKK